MSNNQTTKKHKLTRVSAIHYGKLVFRSILFLVALALYIINKVQGGIDPKYPFGQGKHIFIILAIIWVVFAVETVLRMFPSKYESNGCQKQFKKNYIAMNQGEKPRNQSGLATFAVVSFWIALNGVIGILYFTHIIDAGILILLALLYGICDMICILFFCPFQTWMMKNRCCVSCRIYNWDYPMMCTPLVFIPHLYTYSLLGLSLVLLLIWEISYKVHPERFSVCTNKGLSCANCNERLCQHKKQLRIFWKKNKKKIIMTGNEFLERKNKK